MTALPARGTVLTVGLGAVPPLPGGAGAGWLVVATRFALLDAGLIARVQPGLVLFPLFGAGFDALQVVERLNEAGYRGRMCCVADPLPAPEVVRHELQSAAGGASLDLVIRAQ